jgi:hypothetical protein
MSDAPTGKLKALATEREHLLAEYEEALARLRSAQKELEIEQDQFDKATRWVNFMRLKLKQFDERTR